MIQYKLIKEYPGSLKLGTIVGDVFLSTTTSKSNFPEFYEKVEELDYEILSFVSTSKLSNNEPSKLLSNGNHTWLSDTNPGELNEEELLKGKYAIHSVKRLSDGEVFTIGDEIRLNDYGTMVIEKMTLTDSNSRIKQGVWFNYEGGSCHSDIAVKLKTPLFTTEDGVGIRIDDVYYAIEDDFKIVEYYLCSTPNGYKQFSTKEKAEEYVLLNKPMLSLQDLLNVWGVSTDYENYKTSPLFHRFLELAKSKL